MMFSGGGAYLRVTAGDFNHAVYTAIGRDWREKDGVAIKRGGKRVGRISCMDEPQSGLGDESFKKAGLKPEHTDFNLPEKSKLYAPSGKPWLTHREIAVVSAATVPLGDQKGTRYGLIPNAAAAPATVSGESTII